MIAQLCANLMNIYAPRKVFGKGSVKKKLGKSGQADRLG